MAHPPKTGPLWQHDCTYKKTALCCPAAGHVAFLPLSTQLPQNSQRPIPSPLFRYSQPPQTIRAGATVPRRRRRHASNITGKQSHGTKAARTTDGGGGGAAFFALIRKKKKKKKKLSSLSGSSPAALSLPCLFIISRKCPRCTETPTPPTPRSSPHH